MRGPIPPTATLARTLPQGRSAASRRGMGTYNGPGHTTRHRRHKRPSQQRATAIGMHGCTASQVITSLWPWSRPRLHVMPFLIAPASRFGTAGATREGWCRGWLIPLLYQLYNELLLLLLLASLLAFWTESSHDMCPVQFPGSGSGAHTQGDEAASASRLTRGVTYDMPPDILLLVGALFVGTGATMLIVGTIVHRSIVKALLVLALVLATAEVASSTLLQTASESLGVTMSLLRNGVALGGFTLDLQCTGAVLAILVALRLGVVVVGLPLVDMSMLFFEGAACGVLGVRLAANFYPPLLRESSLLPGAGRFLGYPIVPFWACALPLGMRTQERSNTAEWVASVVLHAPVAPKSGRHLAHRMCRTPSGRSAHQAPPPGRFLCVCGQRWSWARLRFWSRDGAPR